MIPSHQNTVAGPLQYLPHTIIEAQRGPVQRAVDLTPVQPRPAVGGRKKTIKKTKKTMVKPFEMCGTV